MCSPPARRACQPALSRAMSSPALLLALLLGACAAHPPAAPAPLRIDPAGLPPLARAAVLEWQAWGGIERPGWPASPPPEAAATPLRFERLLGYWAAVPGGEGIAAALRRRREAGANTAAAPPPETPASGAAPDGAEPMGFYARPFWSAAFISAIARAAAIPAADLPSAASHAQYIDAALARALADPRGAAFRPEDPTLTAPRPGDLLCADRQAQAPYAHWWARLAERGRGRPLHCDVVVRTAPGEVDAIGGNVEDLVLLRRLPADAEGRVRPAPPGEHPFFLILAARR